MRISHVNISTIICVNIVTRINNTRVITVIHPTAKTSLSYIQTQHQKADSIIVFLNIYSQSVFLSTVSFFNKKSHPVGHVSAAEAACTGHSRPTLMGIFILLFGLTNYLFVVYATIASSTAAFNEIPFS